MIFRIVQLTYLTIGLLWGLFVVGEYTIKYTKNRKVINLTKSEIFRNILLLFIVNAIFWPISMKNNLPYYFKRKEKKNG